MIKRYEIHILGLFVLLTAQMFANTNKIIAVVGDSVITKSEFDGIVRSVGELDANAKANEPALRDQLINAMVNTKLQLNMAERMRISLTDSEKKDVARSIKQAIKKLKAKGLSGNAYLNYMTDLSLAQKVMQMALRERIVLDQATLDARRQAILHEAEQYYVKDIHFHFDTDSLTDQQQALINATQKKWQKRKLTKKALPEGVDLHVFPWASIDMMPDVFKSTIATMQRSDVSVPIKAENGWHMLKLVGKRRQSGVKVDDESLRQAIFAEQGPKEFAKWLAELKEQQYIDVRSAK